MEFKTGNHTWTHLIASTASKAMKMAKDAGMDNVGVV